MKGNGQKRQQRSPSSITDDQIRELMAYARYVGDLALEVRCAMALDPSSRQADLVDATRAHCEIAHAAAVQYPDWAVRHLPRGAFRVAEMIAQFVLDESRRWEHVRWEHIPVVADALVELARKIRTAEWIPREEPGR